jgi:release factor glutamine methyltransferase
MESNLFGAVKKTEKFDLILFNPPYLPTTNSERVSGPLNAAFDGGRGGRKVLDEFLKEFDKHLKPNGTLLLIQSSLNNLEKTKRELAKKKFKVEILETQPFFFEKLYLLQAVHRGS